MLDICSPTGPTGDENKVSRPLGDEHEALADLAAVDAFLEGWTESMDTPESRKTIEQDGRLFRCNVALHPSIPDRWAWQLEEDVREWTECLLVEGFAGSEIRARQLCLLALVVMLSDDRANPLAVRRAKYDLYAD